jgi:hypothetical protein
MDKDLLKRLEDAAKWEDDFIIEYDTKEVWTLIREALPEDKFERIKKLLAENIIDTMMHKRLITNIVKEAHKYDF